MFLDKLILPTDDIEYEIGRQKASENGEGIGYLDNGYPCSLFSSKGFFEVDFERVTIFYGGNGSGKSTLLNVIANKLSLKRVSPFNNSEMFDLFVNSCKTRLGLDEKGNKNTIPSNSMIITSDDIFDYMLLARTFNEELNENIEEGKSRYKSLKYGENIKFESLENYDEFRLQVLSRKKSLSRRKFLKKQVGEEIKLSSNGETAIDYFNSNLKNDTLYCLDEPENSLSPKMQLQLKDFLEDKTRFCGCQLIIATHSPFILAINGAKIYDLDSNPVSIKKWYELENTKTYFDFFKKHEGYF